MDDFQTEEDVRNNILSNHIPINQIRRPIYVTWVINLRLSLSDDLGRFNFQDSVTRFSYCLTNLRSLCPFICSIQLFVHNKFFFHFTFTNHMFCSFSFSILSIEYSLTILVRDSSAIRRLFVRLAGAVGRQSALHKENSGFAAPTLGRHISTFRGYRILFSICNPYINRFTNHFSIHS